jgi:hypothetical protein
MALPWGAPPVHADGPAGYTYGAVAVRCGDGRDGLLARLRALRFTGWVGPVEDGWVLAVAARPGGTVAAGRRGLLDVGTLVAEELGTTAVALRVLHDRQLVIAVWEGADEVGRYVSDPAHGLDDEDVLSLPLGAEHAEAFAAALGSPAAGADLEELLAEELDHESMIESERLALVLRLLGLPRWLVASPALPRDVPGGPQARAFTRLGAGVPGVPGRLLGRAAEVTRKRRRPAPVVPDPPRAAPGLDPWLF